jgi:adenine-specific DNA-methyltransferase
MIYIDPPYNTGGDSFGYNDKFIHSTWLTFMKNRLEVAKSLLKEDGVIFVQADYNEAHYLKLLLDEIFGRDNFINEIIWKRKFGTANETRRFATAFDNIYLYGKSPNYKIKLIKEKTSKHTQEYIKNRFTRKDADGPHKGRLWMPYPLANPGKPTKNLIYEYKGYTAPPKGWRMVMEALAKLDADNRLYFPEDKSQRLQEKKFLDEYDGQPVDALWTDIYVINSQSGEAIDFDGQKPEALIQRMLSIGSEPGDIVLDYHLGSGTTAAVAHKMGRRYIGIEQLEYGDKDPVHRLKRAINGDDNGISKSVDWKGGGSFLYCHLMDLGNKFIEKVKHAATDKELEALLEQAKKSSFLSYKVDPEKINPGDKDFKDLSLAHKKQLLLELVDQNHLYVNYSEIDDADYGVSAEDKKLNKQFYGN